MTGHPHTEHTCTYDGPSVECTCGQRWIHGQLVHRVGTAAVAAQEGAVR